MSRLSKEYKDQMVAKVDALRVGETTIEQACKKVGISWPQYYAYKRDRRKSGDSRTDSFRKPTVLTEEIVRSAIKMNQVEGRTYAEIAERHGISTSTLTSGIYRLRHKDDGNGNGEPVREIVKMSGSKDNETKQLRVENQRLKMIVADLMLDKTALIEYNERGQ